MKLRVRYINRPGTPGEIFIKEKSLFISETSFSDKKVFIDGIEVSTNPLIIPDDVHEITVLQIPGGMGNPGENFLNIITLGIYGAIKTQVKAGQEARRARELAQKFSEINTPSPASSIRGSNNTFRASGRIPIILGKHLLTPDLAAVPYSSYDSDEQWFHQLFCAGYSEVSYSQVKIGDNPITHYTASLSSGISQYPALISEMVLGIELDYDKEITKTTPVKTIRLSVGISFPTGLRKYDENADEKVASVSFQISYRRIGESWTDKNITISAKKDYVRKMYSYSVSGGSYEVKVKRTSKPDSSASSVMDSAYWDVLQSHVKAKNSTLPVSNKVIGNYSLLSLKIKATGQLNGVINELNLVAELNCRDYSGTGSGPGAWEIRKSRNPASALLYVLTHPKINRRPISDDKILWSELEDFHTWCESKSFYFDAVLTGDYTLTDVTDMITFAGRAHLTCYNGFFGVRIERKSQSIDFQLTPRNTKGSMTMNKVFTGNVKNLNCSFIDRTAGYTEVTRICSITPGGDIVYDKEQPGESTDVSFVGITDPNHMMKIAAFELAKASRRVVNYSVPQDWEHLTAFPGAVGYLASDMFLYGLGSGKIKTVYENEESEIVAIESDTDLMMEEGKSYSLMIRMNDPGHGIRIYPIQNSESVVTLAVFESPVKEVIETGNQFIFGERGKEGKRVLCESITPGIDQDGTLQLVDYCEEIYDADSGHIPTWDPGITLSESSSYEPSFSIEDQIAKIQKNTNLQLAQKPTFEELWNGYNHQVDGVPVATTIPVPPNLIISSSGRSVFLSWSKQNNLTGSGIRYEVQIQDSPFESDGIMDGYSINPLMDSSYDSWQGALGGVSITFDQSLTVHDLPLEYQNGFSIERSFYFRVRCRQSNSYVSDWSAAGIVVSPLDSKSMAKDSVTEQMVSANAIVEKHIKNNTITAPKILDRTIPLEKFAKSTLESISFVPTVVYDFQHSDDGFTFYNLEKSLQSDSIIIKTNGDQPWLSKRYINIDGSTNPIIRIRLRRLSGSSWEGNFYYTTNTHSYSWFYRYAIPLPDNIEEYQILELDMRNLVSGGSDWIENIINGFRFDFSQELPFDAENAHSFEIDWIMIGKYGGKTMIAGDQIHTNTITAKQIYLTNISEIDTTGEIQNAQNSADYANTKINQNPIFTNGFEDEDFSEWIAKNGDSITKSADKYSGRSSGLFKSVNATVDSIGFTGSVYIEIPNTFAMKYSGNRVRVSVWAKQPQTNRSNGFGVAYSTNDAGNSGYQQFTPTSSWEKFSFEYDVPIASSARSDFLGIWGDTTGSGLGILIDTVQIEIITDTYIPNRWIFSGTTSINGGSIQTGTITAGKIDSAVLNTLIAKINQYALIGDKCFMSSTGIAGNYSANDRQIYLDRDELTIRKCITSGTDKTAKWSNLLTIGGSNCEIEFYQPNKRIGFGFDTLSEYSLSFAKPSSDFTESPVMMPEDYTVSIVSDSLIVFAESDAKRVCGYMDVNSSKFLWNGEIIAFNDNAVRCIDADNNYGFIIKNTGSDTYLLLTDKNDTMGTFNSLRPFSISNKSGNVVIGHTLQVKGRTYHYSLSNFLAGAAIRTDNYPGLYFYDTNTSNGDVNDFWRLETVGPKSKKFIFYFKDVSNGTSHYPLMLNTDGSVSINTTDNHGYTLRVNGTLKTNGAIACYSKIQTAYQIELGGLGSGDRSSYIDFHNRSGTDFDGRIAMYSGSTEIQYINSRNGRHHFVGNGVQIDTYLRTKSDISSGGSIYSSNIIRGGGSGCNTQFFPAYWSPLVNGIIFGSVLAGDGKTYPLYIPDGLGVNYKGYRIGVFRSA